VERQRGRAGAAQAGALGERDQPAGRDAHKCN
jgi:hypothetical protein